MEEAGLTEQRPDRAEKDEVARLKAHVRRLEMLAVQSHDTAIETRAQAALKLDRLNQWIAEMEVRIAEVEAENTRLKDEIHELISSTSWRATAPLRWVRQRLK